MLGLLVPFCIFSTHNVGHAPDCIESNQYTAVRRSDEKNYDSSAQCGETWEGLRLHWWHRVMMPSQSAATLA
jgi:hypothetical protein